ncbi:MAG: molybdenum cofactor guanylyltransferase [Pyrinomonadaceae bacterium]|jgi:molybdopterin-guanine dinucleotide biosynthesis protein A|nr:molybdenum cofactor guanylyltransferase [Pyrinomonadaceae bacterium]
MNLTAGFILVGGVSSRMGTDKAALLLEGRTFVQRIAEELLAVTESVTLIGKDSEKLQLNLPSFPDAYENWGALGGVHAALSASQSPWSLIVACDLPFVTAGLFARLVGLCEDFEAVAVIQKDGRPQPLAALYRNDPCLVRADQLIKSGERRPIALLQSVRTRWTPFSELQDLPGAEHFFDNINTPQDYERASGKGDTIQAAGMT